MSATHQRLKGKKIALLTLQHFANAPRAQKESGALAAAGAEVTVFGSWWSREKADEDLQLAEQLGVTYSPLISLFAPNSKTFIPRLRAKLAKSAYSSFGMVLPEAYGITARRMLSAVRKLRPDLTIVHCEPGLWAGCRLLDEGFRVGIDFEDWFSEDLLPKDRVGRPVEALARAEKRLLREGCVKFATTTAMSTALAEWAEIKTPPASIPNCFPWSKAPRDEDPRRDQRDHDALSLYWFSQTIGPGRGLEALADSLMKLRGNWQLHLRGDVGRHGAWFEETFPQEIRGRVVLHDGVSNADLAACSSGHDIGLALENPYCKSRDLTATNKIFEYLRCGLAVIATSTKGQVEVMNQCPQAGWVIPPEDSVSLAKVLQNCIDNKDQIRSAKLAARKAASGVWAWESYAPMLLDAIIAGVEEF
jgi:glycosyltransferase involved in cell wall biosynthesis